MLEKNLVAGVLVAVATFIGVFQPAPALAQRYYGYAQQNSPLQFNQQVPNAPGLPMMYQGNVVQEAPYQQAPYQPMVPTYQQPSYQPPQAQASGMMEPYTPNINGVPIDPTTPRGGLDRHGFDGYGNAFNNYTQPNAANAVGLLLNNGYGNNYNQPNYGAGYAPANYAGGYPANYGGNYSGY
jgi:hypothetical protein